MTPRELGDRGPLFEARHDWETLIEKPTAPPGKVPGIPCVPVTAYSRTTERAHFPLPTKMIVLVNPCGYWARTFPAFPYMPKERRARIDHARDHARGRR